MLPADHAQCSQAKEESDVRKWLKSGMPVGMTPVKARPAAAAAAAAADAEARSARPAAPTTGGDDRVASPRISRALFMEVQATLTAKVQQVMHRGLGRTALRDLHRDGLGPLPRTWACRSHSSSSKCGLFTPNRWHYARKY